MSREGLFTKVSSLLVAEVVRPVFMYEGEFEGGTINLWSGYGTLTMSGKGWAGAGELLSISPVQETVDVKATGIELTLTGMPSSLISTVLGSARYGKPGKVWLGLMTRQGHASFIQNVNNYISTPDAPPNSFTSDLEIVANVSYDVWPPNHLGAIVSKEDWPNNNIGYWFCVTSDGEYQFTWSSDGTTAGLNTVTSSIFPAPSSPQDFTYVGVQLVADNGLNGWDVKFYHSTDQRSLKQHGATITGGALPTAIFDSSEDLKIGVMNATPSNPLLGKIRHVWLTSSLGQPIMNGSAKPLVEMLPQDAPVNALTWVSSNTGEAWSLNQSGNPYVHLVHYDEIAVDPLLSFSGKMDKPEIDDSGENCIITVRYENRLVDLQRPRIRHYTPEDQKINHSGDLGFDYVASLQDKNIPWGHKDIPVKQKRRLRQFGGG